MAGLLNLPQPGADQPMPEDQAAAAPPAAPDAGGADVGGDGEPNVTPEEQAQYDEFVKNGMRVIYDGSNPREEVLNRLQQHPDDAVGTLANVTVWLEQMVESSAEASGAQIGDDVKLHGGIALMEELAEVADAAKIHTYTEKELNAALLMAMDLYREAGEQSGKVDPEQLKSEFDQIVAADKAGNVQAVLPQIKSGAPPEDEAAEPAPDDEEEEM